MTLCCYGCGSEGIFPFKSKQSPHFGKLRCAEKYRSCPAKAKEGGDALLGFKHSDEFKAKISATSKGRRNVFKGKTSKDDPRIISGEKHHAFGKTFSDEHKRKISIGKTGTKLTPKRKEQISLQMSGVNNPRYGKGWSENQKLKWKTTVAERGSLSGSNNPNWNPNLDRAGIKAYRSAVMRRSKKNAFAAGLLENLTIGRAFDGFELDHKVPISVCFRENISITAASSIQNLQVIPWRDNVKKSNKEYCKDLLEELKKV